MLDWRRIGLAGILGLASFGFGYIILKLCRKKFRKKSAITPSNAYETDQLVNQYMAFHYATEEKYLKYDLGPKDNLDFPLRCAKLCMEHMTPDVVSRALDIGCAVGRSAFELTTHFESVLGIDFSQAFVDRCNELKECGQSPYCLPDEGEIVEKGVAEISKEIDRDRVTFEQGDACNLRNDIGQFGCVLGANLICRLPAPLDFLDRLPSIVVPGGIVVLTSPYSWLEEYTSKYLWLGGFYNPSGDPVHGFDTLKEVMGPNFDLVEAKDIPFVIRETERKHQWTVAHATVWRRKGKEKSKED